MLIASFIVGISGLVVVVCNKVNIFLGFNIPIWERVVIWCHGGLGIDRWGEGRVFEGGVVVEFGGLAIARDGGEWGGGLIILDDDTLEQ